MLQNTYMSLGFKKIMVYKTPPGGGGEVNHIWLVAYMHLIFYPNIMIVIIVFNQQQITSLIVIRFRNEKFINIRISFFAPKSLNLISFISDIFCVSFNLTGNGIPL